MSRLHYILPREKGKNSIKATEIGGEWSRGRPRGPSEEAMGSCLH